MEHVTPDTSESSGSVTKESFEQRLARAKAEGDPWAQAAGIFKDDPLYEEWVEIMRENRRRSDAAEFLHSDDIEDPARRFAGILRDNPLYEQWQETMHDFRRRADGPTETG